MLEKISLVWAVWDFLKSDAGVAILVALASLSEALAAIPQVKANSVFQAIYNTVKKFVPAK